MEYSSKWIHAISGYGKVEDPQEYHKALERTRRDFYKKQSVGY